MSVCAVVALMALGPVILGPFQSDRAQSLSQGLDELAGCFEDVACCPGEARLLVDVSRFASNDGERFLLREGSLWAISDGQQLARSIPPGFRLLICNEEDRIEVVELVLMPSHTLVLEGHLVQGGRVLEAHIENFDATSETLSAKLSASSLVL